MSDKVKVLIDRDECILCGACWVDCPDVFEEGPDDGLTQVVLVYQVGGDPASGEVPDRLEDCVQTAAEGCPVDIIHVE
jgi:ferredoxin